MLTSCNLGKVHYLSKPQFSHLKYRDSGSDLIGRFAGVRPESECDALSTCLACSKCYNSSSSSFWFNEMICKSDIVAGARSLLSHLALSPTLNSQSV